MWASFKYSLLQLVRVPGVLIWTLVFPIVLGSLFVMMLGALDERAEAVSVNVVVVDGREGPQSGQRSRRGLRQASRSSSTSEASKVSRSTSSSRCWTSAWSGTGTSASNSNTA